MNRLYLLIGLLLFSLAAWAQTDLPQTQQLNIEADKKLDIKSDPQSQTALKIPSNFKEEINTNMKESDRVVKMLPDKELKQAGHDLELDTKVGERNKSNSKKHFGGYVPR